MITTEATAAKLATLSVFDFDGTLTRQDSFVPFLRFAFGRWPFFYRCRHLILPSLQFLLKRLTRDQLKAKLIATFLTDIDVNWLQLQAKHYCEQRWQHLMRPNGVIAVANEVAAGAQVTLCSASPAVMLAPFAERLNIQLIATQLVSVNGRFTGEIAGENCRCANKVIRLTERYGPLANYYLKAWGDSRGDIELLLAAQQPHWRIFHPTCQQTKLNLAQWRKQLTQQ